MINSKRERSSISDLEALALDEEPVVDDSLNVGVEEASDVMTHL